MKEAGRDDWPFLFLADEKDTAMIVAGPRNSEFSMPTWYKS